jgi:hypothetical protein
MATKETIEKVKKALRRGDQPEIARRTGFSKPWVNQVLNCKKGTENEEIQKKIIDVALDIIEKRQTWEKKSTQEFIERVNTIIG